MGISPTTAGYSNTGHDLHMTIVTQDGQTINIENVMQFDAKQETQDITRVRLDNRVLVADLPKLWTGTIQYDRADASTDKAISKIETDWFNGNDYTLGSLIIHVTTKAAGATSDQGAPGLALGAGAIGAAVSGEATVITFYDVALKLDDSGTWKGDDVTSCRLGFRAARRNVDGTAGFGVTSALNQGF